MKILLAIARLLLLIPVPLFAQSMSGTPEEFAEAVRWSAAKFEGKADPRLASGYLTVRLRSGQIGKNQVSTRGYGIYATGSSPLLIVDKEYRHGLYCPSEGEVVVHLPAAGKSFETVVGVDSNQVKGFYSNVGRGSVIATVEVDGKEAFRSGVMHEGLPGVPVKVDLKGATTFALKLSDAGGGTVQGVNFNQADWADARVTLTGGNMVKLGDLPVGPMPASYTSEPPFSFRYGDRLSSELLKEWKLERSERKLDGSRIERTFIYTDPVTALQLRCVAVIYLDSPAVEWTLYFKNTSDKPTPILENILALDVRLERNGDGEFLLHHGKGSPHSGALFTRDTANGLQVQAGQELTHLKLLPGEEIRTPMIAIMFWKGEWIRSQNLWRRWMIAHNLPRPGGKLPPPQLESGSSAQYIEMSEATEENQIAFIDRYREEHIKFDYWWMDAGWHVFKGHWLNLGTWEPDPKRFPHGLRPVSDHLHKNGEKLIVWFVPERASPGTWLYENHPEWLLGRDGERKLFNFGNPAAWTWMTNHVDKLILEQGIDLYRNDGDPVLPSGAPTMPMIARALPRFTTFRDFSPTGMSCAGGIPTCSPTSAPAAEAGTSWRRCVVPCHCGGAITLTKRRECKTSRMECRSGFHISEPAPTRSIGTPSAARWRLRSRPSGICAARTLTTTCCTGS
jgi:alpha-galactosidase